MSPEMETPASGGVRERAQIVNVAFFNHNPGPPSIVGR